jgi:hypothetical protein
MSTQLEQATREVLARQSRRSHPKGKWDDNPRWWPSKDERRDCCSSIREPSGNWPWSLMQHCRTVVHVAQLYDVDESELRRAVRQASKATELPSPATCPITPTSSPELSL